jgi:hypothetical protein
VTAFVEAAEWSGAQLPPGSAVLSRKPSIFYVLSGLPSRAFPFDTSWEAHLAAAEEAGARYLLVDRWDSIAAQYLGAAVNQNPGAFCVVRDFGAALLLGVVPRTDRVGAYDPASGTFVLRMCPADYAQADDGWKADLSDRIPLLESL